MEFGDGSNEWLAGAEEFASDPGQAVTDPYDTLAGTADAAALNFDEGVGGLTSFVDDEPGNTAGPGQTAAFDWNGDGSAGLPSAPGWFDWVVNNQEVVAVGIVLLLFLFATGGTVGVTGGSA